jgi:hypothetical protein
VVLALLAMVVLQTLLPVMLLVLMAMVDYSRLHLAQVQAQVLAVMLQLQQAIVSVLVASMAEYAYKPTLAVARN